MCISCSSANIKVTQEAGNLNQGDYECMTITEYRNGVGALFIPMDFALWNL